MRGLLLLLPALACAQNLTGPWNGIVVADGVQVPFRFDMAQTGTNLRATFYDGDLPYPSDSGKIENGKLHLHWNIYNSDLDATVKDGKINGLYVTRRSNTKLLNKPFTATPAPRDEPNGKSASIAGAWTLKADDNDPKHVWTIVIQQSGPKVSGAIQRLDGDSGTLTGTVQGNNLVMSHFAGVRPAVMRGTVSGKHLLLTYDDTMHLTGMRPEEARAKGIAPPDAKQFTGVKDPSQPFRFQFPDLAGKMVSNTDDRFRGKVVLVNLTGSWCPNCNDDAPFLEELYRKYKSKGLEIVGLAFESGDLDYDRDRVQQFINRHHLTYPVLLAGTTENVAEKLPFITNFAAFPTTFFLGRDGRVKSVHDGFSGVGTGDAFAALKQETEAQVRRLLQKQD